MRLDVIVAVFAEMVAKSEVHLFTFVYLAPISVARAS